MILILLSVIFLIIAIWATIRGDENYEKIEFYIGLSILMCIFSFLSIVLSLSGGTMIPEIAEHFPLELVKEVYPEKIVIDLSSNYIFYISTTDSVIEYNTIKLKYVKISLSDKYKIKIYKYGTNKKDIINWLFFPPDNYFYEIYIKRSDINEENNN